MRNSVKAKESAEDVSGNCSGGVTVTIVIDCGDDALLKIIGAVKDAMGMMPVIFPEAKHMDDLLALIRKAVALSKEDRNDLDAIRQLGEGWVAEETLAIGVYCVLKYSDDFQKGIVAAVNHALRLNISGRFTNHE